MFVLNQMQTLASLGPSCNTKISYLSTSLGRIKGDNERGEDRSQQSVFVEPESSKEKRRVKRCCERSND